MTTEHTNKAIQRRKTTAARKRGLRKGSPAYNRYVYGRSAKQFAHGKAGRGNRYAHKR